MKWRHLAYMTLNYRYSMDVVRVGTRLPRLNDETENDADGESVLEGGA